MVEPAPQNGCNQCLCPQGELQLPPASPGDSPGSACGSDPGSFQMTASALGLGACEILCVPFKSGVSVSHSLLALPEVSPSGLKRKVFWELVFLEQDPQLGSPVWGLDPSLLGRNLAIILLFVTHPPGIWVLTIPRLRPYSHLVMVPSLYP